jgi:hypothetical protein
MRLRSSAFADGSAIPRRFTREDDDISPPLEWNLAPAGVLSLAEATLVGIYRRRVIAPSDHTPAREAPYSAACRGSARMESSPSAAVAEIVVRTM